MSSRPVTPSRDPSETRRGRPIQPRTNSYISGTDNLTAVEYGSGFDQGRGPAMDSSPLAQSLGKNDDLYSASYGAGSIQESHIGASGGDLRRSSSQMSQSTSQMMMPSKTGTLKKKASLRRVGSMKRSGSRRSSRAGSVRSLALGEKEKYGDPEQYNSAFSTPVPTTGSPTEILANRFQAWRKVLKDLINYFRDVQKSHDSRAKSLASTAHIINATSIPSEFLSSGGIGEATRILQDFQKQSLNESNKAKEIENEVILQLTGLRSDLQQKIKEIKSLSGDFKNSVDKETDISKKAVRQLQESLGLVDSEPSAVAGKGDPFIVKLGVDRQIERQIEEENYLHRAYLNLESSGRELEAIVVGEIQKAYTAYANILKRQADEVLETSERLRDGPLAMAKDQEWSVFVTNNEYMVDPSIPVRSYTQITYPGRDHPAASEVRSGMLERKSKYLKNYTPGWYILSPTHLHEFKSADGLASQAPVMSLYLPEQKLGSHSEPGSSSHKFMLKGRQTGGMHRGHTWIFRAESHDTMMAWYADIKELTEKSGKERDAFVRRTHARSLSGGSMKAQSIGSADSGLEEDEADAQPYSSEQSVRGATNIADGQDPIYAYRAEAQTEEPLYKYRDGQADGAGWRTPTRPSPGGRFPSELNVQRGLQAPLSPSSGESSSERGHDAIAAAGALPGSGIPFARQDSVQAVKQSEPSPHSDPIVPIAAATGGAAAGTFFIDRASAAPPLETTQPEVLNAAPESTTDSTHAPILASDPPQPATSQTSPRPHDSATVAALTAAGAIPASHPDEEVAPALAPVSSHRTAQTQSPSAKPELERSITATTISDLQIPGGYPKTPNVVPET